MDRHRVRVRQFVELVEVVGDLLVLVRPHRQGVVLERHAGDHAGRAVEHSGRALVVVVPQLCHLVTDPEHPTAVPPLRRAFPVGGECLLQEHVQAPRPGRATVHRAQHLHVPPRVEGELGRDPPRDNVRHELRGRLRLVAVEPEEVGEPGQGGRTPLVDPMGVHDNA